MTRPTKDNLRAVVSPSPVVLPPSQVVQLPSQVVLPPSQVVQLPSLPCYMGEADAA